MVKRRVRNNYLIVIIILLVLIVAFFFLLNFSNLTGKIVFTQKNEIKELKKYYNFEDGKNRITEQIEIYATPFPNGTLRGKMAYFNGVFNALEVDRDTSFIKEYSVSVWIKPDASNTGWKGIIGKPGRNFNIWYDANVKSIYHGFHDNSSYSRSVSTPVNSIVPKNWTHVLITNDGKIARTYINGELKANISVVGELITDVTPIIIGRNLDGLNDAYFKGNLDEIRIWNYALNENDVYGEFCLNSNAINMSCRKQAKCSSNTDCGKKYYSDNFCEGNKTYRIGYTPSCPASFNGGQLKNCSYSEIKEFVKDCKFGCYNGICNQSKNPVGIIAGGFSNPRKGFACDPNNYYGKVKIRVYEKGYIPLGEVSADIPTLGGNYNCGNTKDHNFEYNVSSSLINGPSSSVLFFLVDLDNPENEVLMRGDSVGCSPKCDGKKCGESDGCNGYCKPTCDDNNNCTEDACSANGCVNVVKICENGICDSSTGNCKSLSRLLKFYNFDMNNLDSSSLNPVKTSIQSYSQTGVSDINFSYRTPGRANFGSSLYLNSSKKNYLLINDSNVISTYSISIWINPSSNNKGWSGIVGRPGRNFNLWYNADTKSIYHGFCDASSASHSKSTNSGIIPGTWNHVVITNDGKTARTYINNVLRPEAEFLVNGSLCNLNNGKIMVGKNLDFYDSYISHFDGGIDELKIWGDAIGVNEINSEFVRR